MEFKTRGIGDIVIYDIRWEFKVVEDASVELNQDVKNHLEEGKRNFIFNLKDVDYMDSDGLGEILGSYISISNREGMLKLSNLAPKIHLMFQAAGLTKVFQIFDDEEEAVENYSE